MWHSTPVMSHRVVSLSGFASHSLLSSTSFVSHRQREVNDTCHCGLCRKIGNSKNGNSVFSVKYMHYPPVLTYLYSPIEWLTFCQNSLTCYYFLWKKLNFHFWFSPIFWLCRHYAFTQHSRPCAGSSKNLHLQRGLLFGCGAIHGFFIAVMSPFVQHQSMWIIFHKNIMLPRSSSGTRQNN